MLLVPLAADGYCDVDKPGGKSREDACGAANCCLLCQGRLCSLGEQSTYRRSGSCGQNEGKMYTLGCSQVALT